MRMAILHFFLLFLVFLGLPVCAQDAGSERIQPETPAIEAEDDQLPATDSQESDDLDALDRLIDENPIDLDPLDVLDTANPLGKVEGLIDEISRNMKEIEKLLDDDDTGEQNQSVQQNTLSRIDELITEVQRLTGT